jgi:hypothetical protein
VTTTSGTDAQFLTMPTGLRRIVIGFDAVSTNGTGAMTLELGRLATFETSGYAGSVQWNGGSTTHSAAFVLMGAAIAADTYNGVIELFRGDPATNTWHIKSMIGGPTGPLVYNCAGTKSLSSEIDRLRVVAGGNTFDAGKIRVEGFFF